MSTMGSMGNQSITDEGRRAAAEGAQKLTERVHGTVDRAASVAHSAADQVTAKADQWLQTQDRLLTSTRDYIREQPITAIGIALAVGFVLSRITR